jgi:pyrrolidone-carboxylate peptidase
MGNDDFSEKQIAPSSARPEEKAKQKLNEPEDDGEAVPTEVAEALEELPPEQRRVVSSMFLSMGRMSASRSSALDKKITPEHISQTLNNLERENERDFKRSQGKRKKTIEKLCYVARPAARTVSI